MKSPLKVKRKVREMAPPGPYRILALSGGGYRGLFAAEVLVRLETRFNQGAIADMFHLFAGTSVGGLIAAGLAVGRTPEQIRDAIKGHGPDIFDPAIRLGKVAVLRKLPGPMGGLIRTKFNRKALEAAIVEVLGDAKDIKVGAVGRPLLLVATCATSQAPFLMSNLDSAMPGAALPLRQALVATAAAPGYFPALDLETRSLVDGGLVANAPDLVALAEVLRSGRAALGDIKVLSVGTAAPEPGIAPRNLGRRGLASWLATGDIVRLTMEAQEGLAVAQAQAVLGTRLLRINAAPAPGQAKALALDRATTKSTSTLLLLAENAVSALPQAQLAAWP